MDNKSRYFSLSVVVVTLTLSIQVFGQTPDAAPKHGKEVPLNPPAPNIAAVPPSPAPPGEKEKDAVLQAVSDVAKGTIEANRVTMEKTAAFYLQRAEQDSRFFNQTTTLIGMFVAVLGGALSFFGIKSAEWLRQYTVDKCNAIAGDFSKRLEDEAIQLAKKTQAVDILGKDLETVRDNARRNNEALARASAAYLTVTYCIIQLSQTTNASVKTKLIAGLDVAFTSANDIIDKDKPTDNMILAWAFTIRGTVHHLREEFEPALRDFERALEISPDRVPTLYNAACSACRLGNKEKTLFYIKRAIQLQPGRHAEAKADLDLQLVWDDI